MNEKTLLDKILSKDQLFIGEWISVKDRLPEKEGKYLVYRFRTKSIVQIEVFQMSYLGNCNFFQPNGIVDEYVTHWMPLPSPPNEDK